MEEYKKPQSIMVNNIKAPQDLQLIIEDIVKAWNEGRVISIQRNNPALSSQSKEEQDEQKILIRIMRKKTNP